MIILEDTRQQEGKHEHKHKWFEEHGIEWRRTKIYCGDYTLPTDQSVCVDTKKDIQELIYDLCGKHHDTFKDECIRANESGIQLYVLVENEGGYIGRTNVYNDTVRSIDDLFSWANPRLFIRKGGKQLYPNATKGKTLAKVCKTMESKYGVKFLFCEPQESAEKIIELLGGINE